MLVVTSSQLQCFSMLRQNTMMSRSSWFWLCLIRLLSQLSWATHIQATPLDRSKYHEPNLVILAQHSCVMTSHVTSWCVSYVQFFRLHFVIHTLWCSDTRSLEPQPRMPWERSPLRNAKKRAASASRRGCMIRFNVCLASHMTRVGQFLSKIRSCKTSMIWRRCWPHDFSVFLFKVQWQLTYRVSLSAKCAVSSWFVGVFFVWQSLVFVLSSLFRPKNSIRK